MAQLEDFVGLLRRLWHGEAIMGHDGPGRAVPVPAARTRSFDEDIPILLDRVRRADARVLRARSPTRSCSTRSSPTRRWPAAWPRSGGGAEQAGRDPARGARLVVLATIGDHIDEELRLKKLVGRLGTYLQGYGDLLVRVERLGPRGARGASGPTRWSRSVGGALDAVATPEQLEHIATLLPDEWLAASATGTPARVRGARCSTSSTPAPTA